MAGIYWNEIETILSPGASCMAGVQVSTDTGVFVADLTDYDAVVSLSAVIEAALNAWQRDAAGTAWELDGNGDPISTKAHPMPPGGPLPIGDVDSFIQWRKDGMPKEAPAVG